MQVATVANRYEGGEGAVAVTAANNKQLEEAI